MVFSFLGKRVYGTDDGGFLLESFQPAGLLAVLEEQHGGKAFDPELFLQFPVFVEIDDVDGEIPVSAC